MAQTVLSVVIEAAPASAARLVELIGALKATEEALTPKYRHIAAAVPVLHFMSLTVFSDDQYDPVFVLEANFDGPTAPFWAQLESAIGPTLRDMLRCAKPPPGAQALFAAVTAAGSVAPLAPLMTACTVRPAVFHQGNRGLGRDCIEREGALFAAARVLADDPARRGQTTPAIHAALRGALMANFAWLGDPARPRIGAAENLADWARLLAFVLVALAVLILPGLLVFAVVDGESPWFLAACAAASVAGILIWLRRLERADPSQDAPPIDLAGQTAMARAEDRTVQNHMISLVHVKPGPLRAVLIRAGLWGLGFYLRVTARDGYLATMRTIHFAHWALVGNGGRLMFHSNYDGSWESYLDDFIEKANVGLTLAWTNAVGFPPTRFLIFDGAARGRRFKAWARHSMIESQFWFSAYKAFTVNQIERQARLAEGLRRPTLSQAEADAWVLDL
ncbi:MAG: hypothetical protein ABI306_07065 [Caulobacteraceae bacterium]